MNLEIVARVRAGRGKGEARKLRREMMIPAVCYGPKAEPMCLAVGQSEFEKVIRHIGAEAKIVPLKVEHDGEVINKRVMIRDLQIHPVKRRVLHVDFYELDMDQPIVVDVPIILTGECEGEKQGGMLNQIRHTVSLRCRPLDIPDRIEVDVSGLEVGESIHIEDLKEMTEFELLDEDHFTVVTVATPAGEAAEEGEEGEEEEAIVEQGEEVTEE